MAGQPKYLLLVTNRLIFIDSSVNAWNLNNWLNWASVSSVNSQRDMVWVIFNHDTVIQWFLTLRELFCIANYFTYHYTISEFDFCVTFGYHPKMHIRNYARLFVYSKIAITKLSRRRVSKRVNTVKSPLEVGRKITI